MEDTMRLYVGNLPYAAQRQDIEEFFKHHNIEINNIDMSIDPFTGRNPSYCFVNFPSSETAQRVLSELQGEIIRGRPVRMNLSTERNTANQHNRQPIRTYDRGWRPKEVISPDVLSSGAKPVFDRWTGSDDAPTHWVAPAGEGRRLYIGGLPRIPNYDTLEHTIRQLFKDFPIQAVSKLISPHHSQTHTQGSRYACFVDIETTIVAKNAVTMLDGEPTPWGGTFIVRPARHSRGTDIVRREQLSSTARIFVGDLPKFVTQKDLDAEMRRLFDGFEVRSTTQLKTPHPSKQTEEKAGRFYYCFVQMSSPQDAQKALEAVEGKGYKVRFARQHVERTENAGKAESHIAGLTESGC